MGSAAPRVPLQLSPNAITVLEKRYLVRDEAGKPTEQAEDLFWRVARTIAAADRGYGASEGAVETLAEAFFELMAKRLFMPNSPTLMNAGRPLGQLSACFVLPVDDALSNGRSGIYDTLTAMALVHQSGGGTGFSFSKLRPKNDIVRSTMGVASGPVSFMSLFDASTDVVKQGGTRRGANMGILRVDHPDILDFIGCKDDTTKVTNFNISVAVTDAFMRAVEHDEEYEVFHPNSGEPVGRLRAREVWQRIIHGAWKTGEPGVFFIDRANYFNPVPHLGTYEATNPCGEQPLLPYDVCNLGSINLGAFVKDGDLDWAQLRRVVHLTTHFLENVIDANHYPLAEITALAQKIRRIGLGVMGLADVFVRLGIAYDSVEAVELGRKIQRFIDHEAKVESERLAGVRGAFPEWERSIWGPDTTCARDQDGKRVRPMRRLRNCNVTTVAPDRNHLDHRRVQLRDRAGLRGGVHAESGRRADARRQRRLRGHRQAGRLVLRGPDAPGGRERPCPPSRGAREVAAGVRDRQRDRGGMARPDAGRVPGVQRQRHLQDGQFREHRDRRRRREDLPDRVRARLQGRDRLP